MVHKLFQVCSTFMGHCCWSLHVSRNRSKFILPVGVLSCTDLGISGLFVLKKRCGHFRLPTRIISFKLYRETKKPVKCYIQIKDLYGAESWTFRKVDQKCVECIEVWCWGRMGKISCTDHVRYESFTKRQGGKECRTNSKKEEG